MNEPVSGELQPAERWLTEIADIPTSAADPYRVYLDSLKSEESRRTMKGALDRIAQIITDDPTATGAGQPWWLLRFKHTSHIRAKLLEKNYSPSHFNKHMIALRKILRICWKLELMSAEDYQRAADIESRDVNRLPAGRNIHHDELADMLEVCEQGQGPIAVRNRAIVAVLYSTGMRRAEVAGALLERYDASERSLRIIGKRDKEREVFVSPTAAPVLNEWLALLNVRRGPMFRHVDKHGNIHDKAMSPRSVGYIVDQARRKAGLPLTTTHDLRRTYTGDLLDAGVDLATVQKLLGHASPTTTARYDRRPGRAARAASDRLILPTKQAAAETEESA